MDHYLYRNGHVFIGPEHGVGIPGGALSVRDRWIRGGKVTSQDVDDFVSGTSSTGSFFAAIPPVPNWTKRCNHMGDIGKVRLGAVAAENGMAFSIGKSVALMASDEWETSIRGPGW
jgi:hypothetical protein